MLFPSILSEAPFSAKGYLKSGQISSLNLAVIIDRLLTRFTFVKGDPCQTSESILVINFDYLILGNAASKSKADFRALVTDGALIKFPTC